MRSAACEKSHWGASFGRRSLRLPISSNWQLAQLTCWKLTLWIYRFSFPGWWWLEPWNLSFSPIVGMMIQSDQLIFFRGVGIPTTSNHQFPIFRTHGPTAPTVQGGTRQVRSPQRFAGRVSTFLAGAAARKGLWSLWFWYLRKLWEFQASCVQTKFDLYIVDYHSPVLHDYTDILQYNIYICIQIISWMIMAMFIMCDIMCDCLYISCFWAALYSFLGIGRVSHFPGPHRRRLKLMALLCYIGPPWETTRLADQNQGATVLRFSKSLGFQSGFHEHQLFKKIGCGEIHHSVSKNTTGPVIFPTLPQSFQRVSRNMLGRIMRQPTSLVKQSHMRTMVRTNMRTNIYLQDWVTTKNIYRHSC